MVFWVFDTICYIIGLHAIALGVYYIGSTLYLIFTAPFNLLQRYGKGSWALVTGASDGIGEGFCYELARDGFNVCLVSRSIDKLKKVEDNVKKINPNIQTKVITADFKKGFELSFYDKLMQDIGDIEISLLINNVGMKNLGNFLQVPVQHFIDETVVNTFSMAFLSRRILPTMLKRQLKAGIINVASVRALVPFPRMPGYSGTKRFNDYFSRSLSYQVEVDVMSLRPMYVTSQMTKQIKGPHVITPQQCARGALNMLGKTRYTNGHWKHRLQSFFVQTIPNQISYMAEARRTARIMAQQKKKQN